MVRNMMETIVAEQMQKELEDNADKYPGLCTCPDCASVMQANALNRLPTYYTATKVGEVYTEYHNKALQNLSDILVAVAKGIAETMEQDPFGHMRGPSAQ